jgi:hypothetical protein
MRGSLWALVVAGLGTGLLLRGAGAALPSSPASSTDGVAEVLDVAAPFAGHLLMIGAIAALLIMAVRAT